MAVLTRWPNSPCAVRLTRWPDFDGIGRRCHVSTKRLLEVLARPPAGDLEVLLGACQEAVKRIPLNPLEEVDLAHRQLISDIEPRQSTMQAYAAVYERIRVCRRLQKVFDGRRNLPIANPF